jgi:hypothetical protein
MPERRCRGLHREAPAEQGRAAPQELLPREAEGLLAVRNRDQEETTAAGPGPRRCGRRVAVREESALHRSRHGTFPATLFHHRVTAQGGKNRSHSADRRRLFLIFLFQVLHSSNIELTHYFPLLLKLVLLLYAVLCLGELLHRWSSRGCSLALWCA